MLEGDIRVGLQSNSIAIDWWESLTEKEKEEILKGEENVSK